MADNINVTPGSGATVAADDVGGVLFQKIKVDLGGDGVSSPLVFGQSNMAASLPVVIASNQSAVPVSDGGGSLTVDGTVGVSGTVSVTGPLTDTQLRATPISTVEIPGATVTVNIANGATGPGLIASSGNMPAGANTWIVCINTPSSNAQLISFTTQFTDGTNWETVPVVWETFTRAGPGALISASDFHQGAYQTIFRAYSEGRPVRVNLGSAPVAIVVTFTPIYVSQPAVTPVRAASGQQFAVQLNVGTSNLRQQFRRISDASINAVVIANSSRVLYSMWASNTSASVKYVKLYTKTTAPVPASDVPNFTYPLQPNWSGFLFNNPVGDFYVGLAMVITGGIADTDTTAIGAGEVVVNAHYGA